MHASGRQHGSPAPRRGRRLAGEKLKGGAPRKLAGQRAVGEFQLRENSLLDTPQKCREAKRSFYRPRRDCIYFARRVCRDGRHRPQDSRSSAAGCLPLGRRDLVGLSSTPCWKRIQRLEADGVIQRRVALVDQDKIGLGVTVFVSVETGDHSQQWLDRFAAEVRAMPEVMEFYRMAGDVDYMLRVVVPDIAGYDSFYKRLIAAVPLKNVTSRFAMEKIKATTALPIP
jgi:Lrp/AsnC family transcriptional regulator